MARSLSDPLPSAGIDAVSDVDLARELVAKLDGFVWRADAATLRLTFASARGIAMLGYDEAEVVAPGFLERIVHPDERALTVALCREVSASTGGGERHCAHRLRRADGEERWFATTVRAGRIEAGRVRDLLGVSIDIMHRVRAEDTLHTSNSSYRSMIEQLPAIVWTTDRDLRFTTGGGAALQQLGVPPNTIVGHTLYEYFQTTDPDNPLIANIRRVLETGEPSRYQSEWLGRVYQTYVAPFRDGAGTVIGTIGVALDVTEQRRAESALRRTEGQLRQLQKMDAIGRLAGGVAHDFNNLLSVILGYGTAILARMPDGATYRAEIEEMVRAGERAGALTRQLLAFSRQRMFELRPVNLNATLTPLTRMLERLIGENVRLVVSPAKVLGDVRADPGQVEQVIVNLVVNARDAMPNGGTLTVETSEVEIDEATATEWGDATPGAYVRLSVIDEGIGMDEPTQAHIFEPFFTTKEVGKGTGLGLSTVFGIVRQSGGHVAVTSAPHQGARFDVYFPRATETLPSPRALPRISPPPGGSQTVLVVEDDAAVRALVRRLLEENGYTVLTASDAASALAAYEAAADAIDLLLTDVVLPRMNGPELAAELRARQPGIRTLFMSGYTERASLPEELQASGVAFMVKPITADVLVRKVHELLAVG